MTRIAVAICFLLLNGYTYYFMAQDAVVPPRASFSSFPLQLGSWNCRERETIEPKVLENLGATDYLICTFVNEGNREFASVYVGYHETQVREEGGGSGENSIHPPAHCLPGSGWDIIDNKTVQISLPGLPVEPAPVKRLVIAKGNARQLVYYWYQSRGRVIAEDWKKIVYVGWDRGTRGRTDGSLVRFTLPILAGDEERSERIFRELAPLVLRNLNDYVPV